MARQKDAILIRRYHSEKKFTKDANKLAESGYKVLQVKREKKFINPLTAVMGGFLFGRRLEITVEYQLSE